MDSTPNKRGHWLGSALLAAVIVGGLIAAITTVAVTTHDWSQRQEAFMALDAIECAAPPGLARADFLTEVQYVSGLPARLDLHDEQLARKLAAAFALHPWVEKVERVQLEPAGKARVSLCFRRPVLAVAHGGRLRAVDQDGVLLPLPAATAGLPVYQGVAEAPGEAGKLWPDEGVQQAAAAARPESSKQ